LSIREENGEFYVAVAPATRTAGILTQLVKGAGRSGSYTGLIGFNPRRLKGLKGDELPCNRPSVYANLLLGKICLSDRNRHIARIWLLSHISARSMDNLEWCWKAGCEGHNFFRQLCTYPRTVWQSAIKSAR